MEHCVGNRPEYLHWLSEYGEVNHERMMTVYTQIIIMDSDNQAFRDRVREIGVKKGVPPEGPHFFCKFVD